MMVQMMHNRSWLHASMGAKATGVDPGAQVGAKARWAQQGESLIKIPHSAGSEADGLQGALLQDVQVQEVNLGGVPLHQQKEPKA